MSPKDKAAPPAAPFNNPFARLGEQRQAFPAGEGPKAVPKEEPKGPARAVVRMERKGRGGKEVTVVEQLGLRGGELESWLKDLKRSLGCGGAVEDDTLVLQGDHRERIGAWLGKRGVRKVSVG